MTPNRYSTIGDELVAAGRFDEAISAYRQALAASPRDAQARVGLDAILERARTAQPNAQLRTLLLEAYADEGANWDAVGWPSDNDLQRLADDPLLHAFLRKSLNRDADLERKLLALHKTVAAAEPGARVSELIASLAEQAWLNEYVWPDDPAIADEPAATMFRPPSVLRAELVEEQSLKATIPRSHRPPMPSRCRCRRCTRPIPIRAGRISRAGRRSTCVRR